MFQVVVLYDCLFIIIDFFIVIFFFSFVFNILKKIRKQMLALKKKREAEKKAAEEAAKAELASGDSAVSSPPANQRGKVSLFGIGGVQKKTKKSEQSGTKKTPSEIRIQKGER